MDIEEGPFETLDIVEVAMNNFDIAMNNDNTEFRKMITNCANKGNIILSKIKSTCSCKHNVKENQWWPQKYHIKKSFTENQIRLEKYQEAIKYMANSELGNAA